MISVPGGLGNPGTSESKIRSREYLHCLHVDTVRELLASGGKNDEDEAARPPLPSSFAFSSSSSSSVASTETVEWLAMCG